MKSFSKIGESATKLIYKSVKDNVFKKYKKWSKI